MSIYEILPALNKSMPIIRAELRKLSVADRAKVGGKIIQFTSRVQSLMPKKADKVQVERVISSLLDIEEKIGPLVEDFWSQTERLERSDTSNWEAFEEGRLAVYGQFIELVDVIQELSGTLRPAESAPLELSDEDRANIETELEDGDRAASFAKRANEVNRTLSFGQMPTVEEWSSVWDEEMGEEDFQIGNVRMPDWFPDDIPYGDGDYDEYDLYDVVAMLVAYDWEDYHRQETSDYSEEVDWTPEEAHEWAMEEASSIMSALGWEWI